MYSVKHYVTEDQKIPFLDWFNGLKDRIAKFHVQRRLGRIEAGNFGDHKFCKDGVWELRIDQGPGYRVYYGMHSLEEMSYAMSGDVIVLLLCAGDKRTQSKDIETAVSYWQNWKSR